MIKFILYFFGYSKVPKEIAQTCRTVKYLWLQDSNDPRIGEALDVIEAWARSCRSKIV